jgi:hypothetical protein
MKATRGPFELVTAQSTASNFTSTAYEVLDIDVEAIQINYTGSPSGTFAIQGSVDHKQDDFGNILVAGNWANLYYSVNGGTPSASVAVPANPSPIIFDTYGTGVNYIQVVWTGTGTGTFSAFLTGKRLGD